MQEIEILRGLHKARAAMLAKKAHDFARGTPFVHGKGTGTSDSVDAHLSRGEAVLPAKTVRQIGASNIARVIADTNNGHAPRVGLRAGGHFAVGEVPGAEDPEKTAAVNAAAAGIGGGALIGAAADLHSDAVARRTGANLPPPTSAALAESRSVSAGQRVGATAAPPVAPAATGTMPGAEGINFNEVKAPPEPAPTGVRGAWQKTVEGAKDLATGAKNMVTGGGAPAEPTPWYKPTPGLATAARAASRFAKGNAAFSGLQTAGQVALTPTETYDARYGVSPADHPSISAPNMTYDQQKQALEVGNDNDKWRDIGLRARGAAQDLANNFTWGVAKKPIAWLFGDKSADLTPASAPAPVSTAAPVATPTAPAPAPAPTAPDPNAPPTVNGTAGLRLGNGITRYNVPGKAPLFSNLEGPGGQADNESLMNRSATTPQDQGALDTLAGRYQRQTDGAIAAEGLRAQQAQQSQGGGAGSVLLEQIQRGLASGQRLTRLGAEMLSHLSGNETSLGTAGIGASASIHAADQGLRGQLAHVASANRGQDITREGNYLTAGAQANRLRYDAQQADINREEQGNKALDEMVKGSSGSFIPGEAGKPSQFDPQQNANFRKYVSDVNPMVKTRFGMQPLSKAAALDPSAANDVTSQLGNEHLLQQFANGYARDALGGKGGTTTGRLKVLGIRPIEAADITGAGNNTHVLDALSAKLNPFVGTNGVEVDLGNGRKAVVPVNVLQNHPQGREMLEAAQRRLNDSQAEQAKR